MTNGEILHGCAPLLSDKDCPLALLERSISTTTDGRDNADLSQYDDDGATEVVLVIR
jgi:hypothetical protein